MTVKKGAEDLTVSVKETATYLRLTRPRTTVRTRIVPTINMSSMKLRHLCVCSGEGCG